MTKYVVVGVITLHGVLPFSYVNASEQDSSTNSQKMPLLEAPISAIPNSESLSVGTVNNSALVAPAPVSKETNDSNQDETKTDSSQISTYKVKSGDTVSGIAKKFGISTNTIIWANSLKKENSLVTGQNLLILPISGVKYIVVKGDTVSSIAEKYKGDAEEIVAYNDLSGDMVKVGDTIVIPDGEMSQTQAQAAQSTAAAKPKVVTSIAKKVARVALGVGIAQADDTSSTANSTAYYIRPIKGGVRTQGIHGNNGVDLGDACGTPIYASASGSVITAKNNGAYNGGYGNYIVISHSNGSQTLYAHMQHTSVVEGSTVEKGEQIGVIGSTGKVAGSTGCHVHFEIRNGPTNPF